LRKACASAKQVKQLTPEEKLDVFQACAQALVSLGEFHAEKPSRAAWFAAFKSARKQLERNNSAQALCFSTLPKAEVESALDSMPTAIASALSPEESAAIRLRIAKQVRAWHAALHAGLRASESRKRRAAFHGSIRTLRALVNGSMRQRSGLSQAEFKQISARLRRLWEAIDKGNEALAQAQAQSSAQALASALQDAMACDKRK
jgi:hypothetical protein